MAAKRGGAGLRVCISKNMIFSKKEANTTMTRGQKKRLEKRQRIFSTIGDVLTGTAMFILTAIIVIVLMAY